MSSTNANPHRGFFWRKVPFYYAVIAVVFTTIVLTWKDSISERVFHYAPMNAHQQTASNCPSGMMMTRLKNYKYTAPLLLSDTRDEDVNLSDLKSTLFTYIEQQKAAGTLADASVYLRRAETGGWIEVNGNATYSPGSMAKLAILITWLKMAQKTPDVLNRQYSLLPGEYQPINQFYPGKEIVAGKNYSVKDLLTYMICESANSATIVLSKYMDQNSFSKVFTDIGLRPVSINDPSYLMSAADISRLMRILFNSSYVGADLSDYGLSLLAKSEFKAGIVRDLPSTLSVAHKFGESGDSQYYQLHETALVYLDEDTYLITVMTKGKKTDQLANCIAEISKITYNRFKHAQQ